MEEKRKAKAKAKAKAKKKKIGARKRQLPPDQVGSEPESSFSEARPKAIARYLASQNPVC